MCMVKCLFLSLGYWVDGGSKRAVALNQGKPIGRLGSVVAGIDGCKRLSTLAGLELVDLAGEDVGIQVVDNAPKGEARAVSDGHRASLRVALHFAEARRQGISFPRNRAMTEALARGPDHVAFIDDDDVSDADCLLRLLEAQRRANTQMISGYWQTGASPMCRSDCGKSISHRPASTATETTQSYLKGRQKRDYRIIVHK